MSKKESRVEYRRRQEKTLTHAQTLGLVLFVFVMSFGFLLGIVLPLRPKESEMESRKLAEFPEFTVESALDGSYFSDISLWYADTYPLRDFWMKGYDKVKSLYGIKSDQIIGTATGNSGKKSDAIPTGPANTPPTPETTAAETVKETEAETEAATEEEELEIPTVEIPDIINGQMIEYFYVNGDTAYEMYFFNRPAADRYGEIVNHVAEATKGESKVYNIIVPLIEAYHLTDEIRHSCEPEWANEEQAFNYYDSLLSDDVTNIPVYNTLLQHRDEYIYFRTDHHWTTLGAYYTYRAFCKEKGIEPYELDHFEKMEFPGFLGTLYRTTKAPSLAENPDTVTAYKPATTNLMTFVDTEGKSLNWNIVNDMTNSSEGTKYMAFGAGDNPFSFVENPNVDNGEVCVILKDSYANCFIPFLVDHYQYIYWFDYRSYGENILNFAKEHNAADIIFINGISPISDLSLMNRLGALLQ